MPYGQSGSFFFFSFSLPAATLDDAAVGDFEVVFAGSLFVDGLLSTVTLLVVIPTASLGEAFCNN